LPEGLDPDEFLGKYGKDAFLRAISEQSSSMTTYRVLALRKEHNLASQKGREDYLQDVVRRVLIQVTSPIELEREIKTLSEEFGVSQEALMQEVQQSRKSTKSNPAGDKPDRKWNTNKYNAPVVRSGEDTRLLPAHIKAERFLLTHMLIDEGVARQVQEALADEFSVDEHGALATYLYAFYAEHDQAAPERFISTLEDRELVKLASMLLMKADELDQRPGLVEEYIRTIRVNQLEKQAKRCEQEMIDRGNRGDLEGMRLARDEMNSIKSYISALKSV
jgi:DNA primase